MDSIGVGDLLAVMNSKDGDGWGSGCWIWIIFLFFIFVIFFNRNNYDSGALTRAELYDGLNYTQLQNGIRENQSTMREGFYDNNTTSLQGFNGVQRDICQSTGSLTNTLTSGFDNTNAAIAQLGYQTQSCCCETQKSIADVKAENYKNTCDITTAIHSEGEATRALINANTMQELRDRLADRDRDLQTANFQLSQQAQSANIISQIIPRPVPSYPVSSPYQSLYSTCGYGCGNCGLTA